MIVQPAYINDQSINIIQDVFSITSNEDKYMDILEKSFGVSNARELFRYKIGFKKEELKEFLNSKYKRNKFNKIYVSTDLVKSSEINDLYNKEVFDKDYNENGWFIFIDECFIANWSHECKYIFVLNERDVTEIIHKWPPKKNIEMEVV